MKDTESGKSDAIAGIAIEDMKIKKGNYLWESSSNIRNREEKKGEVNKKKILQRESPKLPNKS